MLTQAIRKCDVCKREFGAAALFCPHDGQPLVEVSTSSSELPDPLVGQIVERRYRIEERIGRGGMGTVYRATHTELNRPFAIKLIRTELVSDPVAVRRFKREALALGAISHPNAVNVTDCGVTDEGVAFLIMEYLDGASMRLEIAHHAPFALSHAVMLMNQICAAVTAAHRVGVVHRDLKPENIVVLETDAGEVAKVLDFGIARLKSMDTKTGRLTASGFAVGTPRYMSPEACDGEEQTTASDVYSLGVILFEMLTGRAPFMIEPGQSEFELAARHISEPAPPPSRYNHDLTPEIDGVLARALAKAPAARFETPNDLAWEFEAAVSSMLNQAPTTKSLSVSFAAPREPEPSTGSALAEPRRSGPLAAALVAGAILALVLAAIAVAAWLG
jgi:serine/threonine protein kinase